MYFITKRYQQRIQNIFQFSSNILDTFLNQSITHSGSQSFMFTVCRLLLIFTYYFTLGNNQAPASSFNLISGTFPSLLSIVVLNCRTQMSHTNYVRFVFPSRWQHAVSCVLNSILIRVDMDGMNISTVHNYLQKMT